MCGIVGCVGVEDIQSFLLNGLKRLEYRGYDSAGIAVVSDGTLSVRRSAGKLGNLETVLSKYRIGWTLLGTGTPAIEVLDRLPQFTRIFSDSTSVVHVRRDLLDRARGGAR